MDTNFDANSPTMVLLKGYLEGNQVAQAYLYERCEQELRRLARSYMAGEGRKGMLQPTALINEAWIRLAENPVTALNDRQHFVAISATAMRRILVDEARQRDAKKRNGGKLAVSLEPSLEIASPGPDPEAEYCQSQEILQLDEALTRLAEEDEKAAAVVELNYFVGLKTRDIAALLRVDKRTVRRRLAFARAWLNVELSPNRRSE
jgi:RNA polymerase sigma-70 factor, ECF subfamily